MSRAHRAQSAIVAAALSVLLTACHTPPPSSLTAQAKAETSAPEVDPETQCLPSTAAVTRFSPLELYFSAGYCLEQNRLDEAVFLFGTAGSEGRFDTHRVPDTTAHQIVNFMSVMFMQHVGNEAYARFMAHMRQQLDDPKARNAFCDRLKQLPPPTYHPQYMINHGMAAFTPTGSQQPLNLQDDPRRDWQESVNAYMDCGK